MDGTAIANDSRGNQLYRNYGARKVSGRGRLKLLREIRQRVLARVFISAIQITRRPRLGAGWPLYCC